MACDTVRLLPNPMETAALEAGEPGADEPRPPSRHERLRAAAAARGIPLPTILTTCGVVVAIYLAGKLSTGCGTSC